MKKFSAFLSAALFAASCVTASQVKSALPVMPTMEAAVAVIEADYDSEVLHWCIKDEGQWPVDFEAVEGCSDSRGVWNHYPLSVNAEESLQSETLAAIAVFNEQVGFELFRYEIANTSPDIIVIAGGPHFMALAQAGLYTIDGRMRGSVTTYNGLESQDRDDIIVHELGHLVGLRHDRDNLLSIMYPSQAFRAAALEPQDRDALRRIYLGRK